MNNTGMSLSTTVFVVFLILKLTDTIDWSWWWVTSPLWIGVLLWIVLIIGMIIFSVVVSTFLK